MLTRAELLKRAAQAGVTLAFADRLAGHGTLFDTPDAEAASFGQAGTHRFLSRPDLDPQRIAILRHRKTMTADGLLFVAPSSGPGHRGNLIMDDAGDPIWFHRTTPATAMNFRAAVYRGKPVLTWWEGKTDFGLGTGSHVVLDSSYRVVARLPAGRGRPSDLHEFLITPRNTALVSSWEKREADLSPYGGSPNGVVVGGIVQEVALPSGRVLFEWRSLDHVPIAESHVTPGRGFFDYFHINSIELAPDGNLIVSARNAWAIYKIDRQSGDVIWRLGGRKSDFQMGRGTGFAFQHDARAHHGSLLSLFDNGGDPRVQPQSQGLILHLDEKRMRATVRRRYVHHPNALAHALGSVQLLGNGNVLIGWGTAPYFSEHHPNGEVVFDAKLPGGGQNYRALRLPWRGEPAVRPAVSSRAHAGGHLVSASWNGATEVAAWRIETGTAAGRLTAGPTSPRTGFETTIAVPVGARFARMVALDARGKPLRRSKILDLA